MGGSLSWWWWRYLHMCSNLFRSLWNATLSSENKLFIGEISLLVMKIRFSFHHGTYTSVCFAGVKMLQWYKWVLCLKFFIAVQMQGNAICIYTNCIYTNPIIIVVFIYLLWYYYGIYTNPIITGFVYVGWSRDRCHTNLWNVILTFAFFIRKRQLS